MVSTEEKQKILEDITGIIYRRLPYLEDEGEVITLDSVWNELSSERWDCLQIVLDIEKHYGIKLEDDVYYDLDEMCKCIGQALKKANRPFPPVHIDN